MPIRLSRPARRDLDHIRRYTLDTWGRTQWLKYYRGLVRAFEGVIVNPGSGRDRSRFVPGMGSVMYGKHFIFYAPTSPADDAPVILRIVAQHRTMRALVYYEDSGG
ncbi:MAG: type II toxin-antitoxin system RelE/ParE family toxin [Bryobacterales bacterium]|nr:type II toxin-antitoxin system RelE/ParE family toxin [Bryobacterales bacterium]